MVKARLIKLLCRGAYPKPSVYTTLMASAKRYMVPYTIEHTSEMEVTMGSVRKSRAGRVRHSDMKSFIVGGFSSTRGRNSGIDLVALLVLFNKTKASFQSNFTCPCVL